MEKKQVLIEILRQLEWHWELARWFLVIVEKSENEKIIDDLIKLIQTGIRSIKDKRIRAKLVERVKEMQMRWDIDQENSSEEAENLLDDFIKGIEE